MKDYKGAADNAEALARFTFRVQAVLSDDSEEQTPERKLENLQAILSGPDVLPCAHAALNGDVA
jgi:hypothetical protein